MIFHIGREILGTFQTKNGKLMFDMKFYRSNSHEFYFPNQDKNFHIPK